MVVSTPSTSNTNNTNNNSSATNTSQQMSTLLDPDNDEDLCKLYVSNISNKVEEKHLYELFLQAGPLRRIEVPAERDGRKRNFAFVIFKHHESVGYAIKLMNKLRLFHMALELRPYQKRGPVGGEMFLSPKGGGTGQPPHQQQIDLFNNPAAAAASNFHQQNSLLPLPPPSMEMFSPPLLSSQMINPVMMNPNLGFPASFPHLPSPTAQWPTNQNILLPMAPPPNQGHSDNRNSHHHHRGRDSSTGRRGTRPRDTSGQRSRDASGDRYADSRNYDPSHNSRQYYRHDDRYSSNQRHHGGDRHTGGGGGHRDRSNQRR